MKEFKEMIVRAREEGFQQKKGMGDLERVYSEVMDRRLYFGGFPSREHWEMWIRRVAGWGGTRITMVDLTTPLEKEEHALEVPTDEVMERWRVAYGVRVTRYSFPIPDNQAPVDREAFEEFLGVLRSRYREDTSPCNPMIIHCKGGHGRSAMVMIGMLYRASPSPIDIHDVMNVITQIHHLRRDLHPKYRKQLCPTSACQRTFLKKSLAPG